MDNLQGVSLKETFSRIAIFAFGVSCAVLAAYVLVDSFVFHLSSASSFHCRIEIEIFGRIVMFAILCYITAKCGVCPLPRVKSWSFLPTPWKWWQILKRRCRSYSDDNQTDSFERALFKMRYDDLMTYMNVPVNYNRPGPSGLQELMRQNPEQLTIVDSASHRSYDSSLQDDDELRETVSSKVPRSKPIKIENQGKTQKPSWDNTYVIPSEIEHEPQPKICYFPKEKFAGVVDTPPTLKMEEMLKRAVLARKGLAKRQSIESLRKMMTQKEPVLVTESDMESDSDEPEIFKMSQ